MCIKMKYPILSQKQCFTLKSLIFELYGMGGLTFLETSAVRMTNLLDKLGIHGKVVVCCGKGSNAALGLIMARYLANRQYKVETWMVYRPEELSKPALANYEILDECQDDVGFTAYSPDLFQEAIQDADWVVDALLGIGASGAPRAPLDGVINTINAAEKKVFAIDIPSGLDMDLGVPYNPTIIAKHTGTFINYKKGFFNPQAKEFLGEIHMVDMDIPANVFSQLPPD